ncbi:MAG: hypothetical protein HY606_03385 [Planctomycetes bacterium]|nr:hypothetical protein [Planctomycetota bacterium]
MGGKTTKTIIFLSVLIIISSQLIPSRFIIGSRLLFLSFTANLSKILQDSSGRTTHETLNQELKEELSRIQAENERLRNALFLQGFFSSSEKDRFDLCYGEVIRHFLPTDPVILLKIKDDRISRGNAVIFEELLIGVVDEVNSEYCKVILSTHSKFKAAAHIFDGEKAIRGVAKGEITKITLRLPLHSVKIAPFAPLRTTPTEIHEIPENMLIGQTERLRTLTSGESEVVATVPIDFASIHSVIIAVPKQ